MNNQNNITELRGLKDKSIDIKHAKAISDTAQVIINSAKIEADYAKHNKKKTTSFMHDKIVDSSSDESNDIDDDDTYDRRELADVNRMEPKLTSPNIARASKIRANLPETHFTIG
ncbi:MULTISPECIES: hypothetical protein [Nitrosomonas]|uniref:Uncharacterized protein n=1 Tax=Nitrosomonas communis TaxID=44574 RepID=A0A0F7KHU2_9PROT|nr:MULTISPECIES: hypothetical protein [Nitrosomonas]AKH38447.1 hypothetical protein AAW31_12620 [Nitrosomonas communis]TYP69655.1 hypothetical protein BCL69_11411 [Nitrosomonas communis]UVS60476.1 hypothetical protein NX761_13290 [Nitrosomonas sp. PLL12]